MCYFGLLVRAPSSKKQKTKNNTKKKEFSFLSQYASQAFQIEIKSLPANEAPRLSAASVDAAQSVLIIRFRLRTCREHRVFEALLYFLHAELSSSMPLESDMKKQEHLWQNQSPNFLAEKVFNTAMAALPPHCAVCSLFCPFLKVRRHGPTPVFHKILISLCIMFREFSLSLHFFLVCMYVCYVCNVCMYVWFIFVYTVN